MQAKIEFNFTLNTQNMNKESVYLYAYKNVFINSTKTKESLKIDRRKSQPTLQQKQQQQKPNKRNTKAKHMRFTKASADTQMYTTDEYFQNWNTHRF